MSIAYMADNKQAIIDNFLTHINEEGSGYEKWFVGITTSKEAMLTTHNLDEYNDWWIYETVKNHEEAKSIKLELLKSGLQSKEEDSGANSKIIYAIKITHQAT